MDHNTFISGLARQLGKTNKEVTALTDSLANTIREAACNLDNIAIPGFGRFEPEKRDEYIAEDPHDGIIKLYPPSISINFIPGSKLKKRFSHE